MLIGKLLAQRQQWPVSQELHEFISQGLWEMEQQGTHLTPQCSPNYLSAKLFGRGLVPTAVQRKSYVEQTLCETLHTQKPRQGKYMCSETVYEKASSKCLRGSRLKYCIFWRATLKCEYNMVCKCVWFCVYVCARLVHCSCLHASQRSEGLAAESRGLRHQEIKHEMKTSSSLNILPSHFPISPLPLTDLKRREERDMERGVGVGGGVARDRRAWASTQEWEYNNGAGWLTAELWNMRFLNIFDNNLRPESRRSFIRLCCYSDNISSKSFINI